MICRYLLGMQVLCLFFLILNKKGGLAPASKYKERDIVILIDLTSLKRW